MCLWLALVEDEGLAGTGGTGQAHHAHTGLAADGGHLQPQQEERGQRRLPAGSSRAEWIYFATNNLILSSGDAAVYHPGWAAGDSGQYIPETGLGWGETISMDIYTKSFHRLRVLFFHIS